MESKDKLLKKLSKIYSELSKRLDRSSKNFCGSCSCCCTCILDHGISKIEYDYIEIHLKDSSVVRKFMDYIRKKRNLHGKLIYTKCPLYDEEKKGCSIYLIRPYSCRIFGHYGRVPVPLYCSFSNFTIIHPVEQFYEVVPKAGEFFKLKNLYEVLITEDPLEKAEKYYSLALHECYRNNIKKAEKYLISTIQLNISHSQAHYQLGIIYYNWGDLEGAIKSLRNAILYEPDNIKMKINLGLFLIKYGKYKEAKEEFLRILEKDPQNHFAISAIASISSYK